LNNATALDNILEEQVKEFARTNMPTAGTSANDVVRSSSICCSEVEL